MESNFMRKIPFATCILASVLTISAIGAETPVIGVVNFATCVTESKAGQQEQQNMEAMRKQMSSLMEDTEKELREIAGKFEDSEYLDSLSPKAEEDLKVKFQTLQEDLNRYQNQFYQVLNHANYQMVQKMSGTTAKAAEKVALEKHLDYVMNKEACFYIRSDLDVTTSVIAEMDRAFELEAKAKKVSDAAEDLPAQAADILESAQKAG